MTFYTPESFRKGNYIANKFRPIDLLFVAPFILLSLGLVILFAIFLQVNVILKSLLILVSIFPGGIAFTLILSMPGYHNVMEYLKLRLSDSRTYKHRYMWEGILIGERQREDEKYK